MAVFFCQLCVILAEPSEDNGKFYRLESYPHALTKPFLDKYLSSRFYDYGGHTVIKSDSYIRLTGDRADQSGWLFSKLPAMPDSFQVEFDFKIHGGGGGYLSGDGLAFWITSHKGGSGNVFGSKNNFEGLGIFFDTYKNNRPGQVFPLVMAMTGNGHTSYDHDNDGLANELASCTGKGLVNANGIAKARVTFVKDKFLALDLDLKEQNKWKNCFVIDSNQIQIPQGAFLGFSARTGQLHENHEIHRVQVFSLRNAPDSYKELQDLDNGIQPVRNEYKGGSQESRTSNSGSKSRSSKQGGSWLGFFFKLLLFVGAVALAVVGYGIYISKNKQQKERSRDYYI